MTPANPRDLTEATIDRACSEFLEMPGLRLTAVQAQRLWGFDKATCARVLDFLVAAAFLTRDARGTYRRLTDGTAGPLVPLQKGWIEDFRLAGRLETPVLLTTHDAA